MGKTDKILCFCADWICMVEAENTQVSDDMEREKAVKNNAEN